MKITRQEASLVKALLSYTRENNDTGDIAEVWCECYSHDSKEFDKVIMSLTDKVSRT